MSIWDRHEKGEIAYFGFKGLPQEYIKKLAREYKAYGFITHVIGNHVIVETNDLIVLTDIFRIVVPPIFMAFKGFRVISGSQQELEELEKEFKDSSTDNMQNGHTVANNR